MDAADGGGWRVKGGAISSGQAILFLFLSLFLLSTAVPGRGTARARGAPRHRIALGSPSSDQRWWARAGVRDTEPQSHRNPTESVLDGRAAVADASPQRLGTRNNRRDPQVNH